MEITDLITPRRVIATLPASDKPQLLRQLSERAARPAVIGGEVILDALNARESLGSTGVGQGIALPHARIAGLDRFVGLFARLERPINFDAIDAAPVDLVFLLLLPDRPGGDHLAALAAVSRRLRHPNIAARLRRAQSGADLYDILTANGA